MSVFKEPIVQQEKEKPLIRQLQDSVKGSVKGCNTALRKWKKEPLKQIELRWLHDQDWLLREREPEIQSRN